jgi:hypothetical protein
MASLPASGVDSLYEIRFLEAILTRILNCRERLRDVSHGHRPSEPNSSSVLGFPTRSRCRAIRVSAVSFRCAKVGKTKLIANLLDQEQSRTRWDYSDAYDRPAVCQHLLLPDLGTRLPRRLGWGAPAEPSTETRVELNF